MHYPRVELSRFCYGPHGVFGMLGVGGFRCFTVERPWKNNIPRESCIPRGVYRMVLGRYNRGDYPAYELLGVPNRSLIKIHVANVFTDVLGCIGPGKELGYIAGKWAVTRSREAFREFMDALDGVPYVEIDIHNTDDLG